MRVDTDVKSKDYWELQGEKVRVFLDGVELSRYVCSADEEKGEVVRFASDEDGQPVVDGNELVTETLRGKVEIVVEGKHSWA